MIPTIITNFVLPLALSVLRSYLSNPSSSKDGEVLDTVKESIWYLANKDNNSITEADYRNVRGRFYFGEGV